MKKIREYHICDRCKEELVDEPIIEYDYQYMYELCNECDEIYKQYKNEIKLLEDNYDKILKFYKFGKYLFERDLESKGEQ